MCYAVISAFLNLRSDLSPNSLVDVTRLALNRILKYSIVVSALGDEVFAEFVQMRLEGSDLLRLRAFHSSLLRAIIASKRAL